MADERDCLLYLLAHKTEPLIKIGVANNVFARASALAEPLDFSTSFVASGSREACYRAEKVLHKLLDRHRAPPRSGDGGTEWFDDACSVRAMELLTVLSEDLGISPPQPCPTPPRTPPPASKQRRRQRQAPDPEEFASACEAHGAQNLSTIARFRSLLDDGGVLLTGSCERHFQHGPASTTIYVVKRSPPVSTWRAMDDFFNARLYREPGREPGWTSWERYDFAERKLFSSWSMDSSFWISDLSSIESYCAPADSVYSAATRAAMMAIVAELLEKETPGVADLCRNSPSFFAPDQDATRFRKALECLCG